MTIFEWRAKLWACSWLLILGFSGGPITAAANGTVLKVATPAPEGTAFTDVLLRAADAIEVATAQNVRLKVYPASVMGSDKVVLRKMRTGQLQGAVLTAGGLAQVYRDVQILSLPFLLSSYEERDAVLPEVLPRFEQGLRQTGFVFLGMVDAGFVYMMSQSPVRGLSDLRGRRIWIPEGDPIGAAVFDAAGVSPIPLPIPDVLTGLETGLLDTVSAPPVGSMVLQWFTRVDYLVDCPLLYSYLCLVFSNEAWDRIPAEWQPQVRRILHEACQTMDQAIRNDNSHAMDALRRQGIQFISLDSEKLPELTALTRRVTDQLVREQGYSPQLLQRIRETLGTRQGEIP